MTDANAPRMRNGVRQIPQAVPEAYILEVTMSKSAAKDQSSANSEALPPAGINTKKHPAGKRGNTMPSQNDNPVPRLPHERDESADSQSEKAGESPSAALLRQAFKDVERGLVNTDRALEGDTRGNDAPLSDKSKRGHKPG